MNKDIRYEIQHDERLVPDGWDIEWHIEGRASQSKLDALENAGINVTY